MKNNSFIWTDLSTYQPAESSRFYHTIFDWQIHEDNGYRVAYQGGKEIAGIYETPAFFQKINMPHFWMNYLQVAEVATIVEKARRLGARVEMEKQAFYGGQIALIRDPMGAGFTVYDGDRLRQASGSFHGAVMGRELHVSNAAKAIDFYSTLFDWQFVEGDYPTRFDALLPDQTHVASVEELDNALKGKYEYWVTIFGVANLPLAHQKILAEGGTLVVDEGNRRIFTDSQGEAFFYIQEH
ncbi:MAG: VOC family protein [Bacteroidota bacterium]